VKPSVWPGVWNGRGRLTLAALELLNRVAREEEVWLYPLPQLAADMGRARLLAVTHLPALNTNDGPPGPGSWVLTVADNGWYFVTDEEGLRKRRLRIAFKKLGGKIVPEVPSKPPPDEADA
jgi:hypothetical protein